jgi:hypothetical protein
MKKYLLTLVAFLVLAFPYAALAASVTETFDACSDGDTNGYNSWSGSVNFDCQGTVTQSGAKAVVHQTAASGVIAKSFGSTDATGTQQIYGRVAGTTDELWMVRLREAGSSTIIVKTNGGNLQYFDGGSYVTIGAVSLNTWFQLDVEWDAASDTARYRLDGGSWTSFVSFNGTITTGIDDVALVKGAANATAAYWDTLSPAGAVAAAADVKVPDLIFFN